MAFLALLCGREDVEAAAALVDPNTGPAVAGLRAAVRLAEAAATRHAVDYLMACRGDAAVLLDAAGQVLAASAGARPILRSKPALSRALARHVRRRPRPSDSWLEMGEVCIRLDACAEGEEPQAYLAQLSPTPVEGSRRLTSRQAEILELLRQGLTNLQIAGRLGLSRLTVKTTLERLYRRAGVAGRVGLVRWADGFGRAGGVPERWPA